MKEKEVYLSREEIDYLLKGSIHWEEIETRVDTPYRKPIEPENTKSPLGKRELLDRLSAQETPKVTNLSKSFLEGTKVLWLLLGVGIITIGTWVYFVFAG
jgi:hypothetical protein